MLTAYKKKTGVDATNFAVQSHDGAGRAGCAAILLKPASHTMLAG